MFIYKMGKASERIQWQARDNEEILKANIIVFSETKEGAEFEYKLKANA